MRLRLPGETVYDVRGLAVPAEAADLERSDAGQLFLEEARGCARRRRFGPAERAASRGAGCSTATPWRSSSLPAACAG